MTKWIIKQPQERKQGNNEIMKYRNKRIKHKTDKQKMNN